MNWIKRRRGTQFNMDIHHILIHISSGSRKTILPEHRSWMRPLRKCERTATQTQPSSVCVLLSLCFFNDTESRVVLKRQDPLGNWAWKSICFHCLHHLALNCTHFITERWSLLSRIVNVMIARTNSNGRRERGGGQERGRVGMGEGGRKQEGVPFKSLVFAFLSLKGNKQKTNKWTRVFLVTLFISHVFSSPFLIFLNCFCLRAD